MSFSKTFIPLLVWFLLVLPGVYAQNVAPQATDDTYSVGFGVALSTTASNGLLNNDSDSNGNNTLSVQTTPVSGPTNGALLLNADGSFTYTPNAGFLGSDTFIYRVCDDGTPNTLVSQFDFDTATLTDATVGPNATSINANAAQTGCGMHFPTGAGGSTGFDLVIPNASGIFDFTSFEVSFEYQDQESQADIITAGNFRVYHIRANSIAIEIDVVSSVSGVTENFSQELGDFISGNNPYTIRYDEVSGEVLYTANGTTTTFSLAPPNSPLDSSLATDITVGRRMDGSGSSLPSLCSVQFIDASPLCDTATVTLNVIASVITNRRITYRVRPN